MYTVINTKEEFIDQYFPKYDELGEEIPNEGITLTNKIVTTTGEYEMKGDSEIVDIPHFNPQSEADIILGITNREITERRKRGIE